MRTYCYYVPVIILNYTCKIVWSTNLFAIQIFIFICFIELQTLAICTVNINCQTRYHRNPSLPPYSLLSLAHKASWYIDVYKLKIIWRISDVTAQNVYSQGFCTFIGQWVWCELKNRCAVDDFVLCRCKTNKYNGHWFMEPCRQLRSNCIWQKLTRQIILIIILYNQLGRCTDHARFLLLNYSL